jgi:hypothetical protein
MLEKIVNIKPGSDYRHSSSPNKGAQAARYLNTFHSGSSDSFSLSPATVFLSSIHWQLKNFHNENEKLFVNFSFDEFDFSISILVGEISITTNFDYEIKRIYNSFIGNNEILAKISSPLYKEQNHNIEVKQNLPVLQNLYKSILELHERNGEIGIDDYFVGKIFIDLERNLLEEFTYINMCLLNFLEKYLSLRFNSKNDVENKHLILRELQIKRI